VVTDCDLAGHVPGWPALEGAGAAPVDREGLLDFYERFGFKTWRGTGGHAGCSVPGGRRWRRPWRHADDPPVARWPTRVRDGATGAA
jgi:hypothetical protein